MELSAKVAHKGYYQQITWEEAEKKNLKYMIKGIGWHFRILLCAKSSDLKFYTSLACLAVPLTSASKDH